MRRLAAILTVLTLFGAAPVVAAPIAVKQEQSADAIWLVPTDEKNHFTGYYANVMLEEPSEGDFGSDYASVGKGHCIRERTPNSVSTSCTFNAWAGGPASKHFEMDPLMRSAELRLRKKGKLFVVRWTADDRPFGFYVAHEACYSSDDDEPREGDGGGLLQTAKSEADIFGVHLERPGGFLSMLMSGAMVTQCTRYPQLVGLRPGERVRVTL